MPRVRLRDRITDFYRSSEIKSHELMYLFLEITRKCSLRCRHCGSDCRKSDSPELSLSSWIALLDHILEHFGTNPAIVVTGGEPLEHPGFHAIASELNRRGFVWGLVTNAYRWSDSTLPRLIDANVASVTISLDGPKEEHVWLRRAPESWDQAVRALGELADKGVLCDAVTCVHPGNIDRLEEIARILLDLGVPRWRVFRIFPSGRARGDSGLHLDAEATERLLAWVSSHRPLLGEKGLELSLSCEGWFPSSDERLLRTQTSFCRSGINFASILSDGTIAGCSNNPAWLNQGSVLSDSFAWVWEHRFTQHRSRSWIATSACSTCKVRPFCHGGALHLWHDDRAPSFCYHQGSMG